MKPGGTLGVVEHRLPEAADDARQLTSGYVKVSTVRRLAEQAGFKFVGIERDQRQSQGHGRLSRGRLDTSPHPRAWRQGPGEISGDRRKRPDDPEVRQTELAQTQLAAMATSARRQAIRARPVRAKQEPAACPKREIRRYEFQGPREKPRCSDPIHNAAASAAQARRSAANAPLNRQAAASRSTAPIGRGSAMVPAPVTAENVDRPRHRIGGDRQSAGQRLDVDQAEGVGPAREDEHVRRGIGRCKPLRHA